MEPYLVPFFLAIVLAALERFVYVAYLQKRFLITFADAPVRSLLYFSAWTVLFVFLFPKETAVLFAGVNAASYLLLAFVLLVIFPFVFRWFRKRLGAPGWLSHEFPTQGLLTLEEGYIVGKVGDVISQQVTAGILVVLLAQAGVSYQIIVFVFLAVFALSHLYLFATSGFIWGMYYTGLSLGGGFAIPFLVLFMPYGIIWSIILHMLFYVFAGAFFAKLPRPTEAVCRDLVGVGLKG